MNTAYEKPRLLQAGDGLSMSLLMATMLMLLALLVIWGSHANGPPSYAYGLFISSSTVLAACGTLLSRSDFVAARLWLRARVAPVAGLKRARSRHLRQLLYIWAACAASVIAVSNSAAQGLGGPLALALLMACIAAIAEWSQLQKPLLHSAWAAWAARWHWLDSKRHNRVGAIGLLPSALLQTWSPASAHSGLPQWAVTCLYLLRLAAFTVIALQLLQSPDLHWRRLLAPGGRRRYIGGRILCASLKGNLAITAFAAGLALAAAAAFGAVHWAQVLAIAAVLLPDLLLATLLAVTLRGFASGPGTATVLLLGALAVGCLTAWLAHLAAPAVLSFSWQRDLVHAGMQLAAMLVLLPLLQHAWLRADLVRLAAREQEPPDPTGWEH